MRKILSLLFVLFFIVCYGQQRGDIIVNWSEKLEVSYGNYNVRIPSFTSESFFYNESRKEIFFNLKIPITSAIDQNALEVTNVIYESITPTVLGDL